MERYTNFYDRRRGDSDAAARGRDRWRSESVDTAARTGQRSSAPVSSRSPLSANINSSPRSQGYYSLYRNQSPTPRARAYSYTSSSRSGRSSSRVPSRLSSTRRSPSPPASYTRASSTSARSPTRYSSTSVSSSTDSPRYRRSPSIARSYSTVSRATSTTDNNITNRLNRKHHGWSIGDTGLNEDKDRAKRLEQLYLARPSRASDDKSESNDDNIAKRLNRKHLGWTNNSIPSSRSSSVAAKTRFRSSSVSSSSSSSSSSSDSSSSDDESCSPENPLSAYRQRYSLQLDNYPRVGRPLARASVCLPDQFPVPLHSRPKSFAYHDVCKQIANDFPVVVREMSPAGHGQLRRPAATGTRWGLPSDRTSDAYYEIRRPLNTVQTTSRSRSRSALASMFSRSSKSRSRSSQSRNRYSISTSAPPPYSEIGKVDPLQDPNYFSSTRGRGGRLVDDKVVELSLEAFSRLL